MAETPFTVDAARSLTGAGWLRDRREAAAVRLAALAYPDPSEEIWRYSRVAELDRAAFAPVTTAAAVGALPHPVPALLDAFGPTAATVVAVDGRVVRLQGDEGWAARGLVVGMVDRDGVVGSVMTEATDWFAELNNAFVADPVQVTVPAGMAVTAPVLVVNVIRTAGAAVFPRLVVSAGEDAEVTVIDVAVAADGLAALTAPVIEVAAAQSARVRIVTVNELGDGVWQIGSMVARGERDSTTTLATVALGGHYARLRTDARLAGQGAQGDQVAAFFGTGTQMHDFRTLQDHQAPKSRSNLLFKGVVDDAARSVYTGLIRVRPEAPGSDAFQTNRNVKLSKDAWAESVPNLQIETNDVRCSHASTVGPVDEDQLFYLESRGVPTATAERLVVLGFLDEVITGLPVPPAFRDHLRASVVERLDRHAARLAVA